MLLFADCVPVYLVDPVRKVDRAGPCRMARNSGEYRGENNADNDKRVRLRLPSACFAAVGPSIGESSYEVGPEVADHFRSLPGARASTVVMPRSDLGGTYNLNLRAVIFGQLLYAGVPAGAIAVCDEDTFRNKRDFFPTGATERPAAWQAFLGIKKGHRGKTK